MRDFSLIKVVLFFGALVKFSEDFGDWFWPETAKKLIIFFGAKASVNDFCGGRVFGNAMAHENLWDKGKGMRLFTKSFPGVPVDIAFEF